MSDSGIPSYPVFLKHSGHLSSSQLRDDKPDEKPGLSPPGLLNPDGVEHHREKNNSTSHVDNSIFSPNNERNIEENKNFMENKPKRRMKGRETDDTEEVEISQGATINPAPFRFKPYELSHMLDPKSIDILVGFGGIDGLLRGLGTNADTGLVTTGNIQRANSSRNPNGQGASSRHDVGDVKGISSIPSENDDSAFSASLEDRRRIYGENVLPTRITLLQLLWPTLMEKILILLSIVDVVSLALYCFQCFGPSQNESTSPVYWAECVEIMVVIPIVIIIDSLNDWRKELQIKDLNGMKEEHGIKVVRDGVEKTIHSKEVVVGDIALLEPGDVVPCDGIFISGHNLRCDESGVTGESYDVNKVSFAQVLEVYPYIDPEYALHEDCFIISGSKVVEGVGKYVIVAVGNKSFNGRIMLALRGDAENTPIHVKLSYFAGLIAKIGSSVGSALFLASMIGFFVQLGTPSRNSNQYGALVIAITSIVVAIHEGLPLAVTLALAFVTKCMAQLVPVLGLCETTTNASGAHYMGGKVWGHSRPGPVRHVHSHIMWERRKLHYISPIARTTIKRELYQLDYSQTTVDTDARAHVGSQDPIISIPHAPSLNDVTKSSSNKIPHQYCTGVTEVSTANVNDTVSFTSIKRTRSPFDSNTSDGNHKEKCQSYTHHSDQASTTFERIPSTSKPTPTIRSEPESTNLIPAYHQFFTDGIEYQELVSILAPVVASIVRHHLMWAYTRDFSKRTAGMTADLQARELLDFIAARSHIPKFRSDLLEALKAQSDLNGFVKKRI